MVRKLGDFQLRRVQSCKYLGIIVDDNLNRTDYIDNVCKKIKFTSFFYKIRIRVPPDLLRTIYYAFVHPYLSYGIERYGNASYTELNRLIVINSSILRIIHDASKRTRTNNLYKNYDALMIPMLHNFRMLLMHTI